MIRDKKIKAEKMKHLRVLYLFELGIPNGFDHDHLEERKNKWKSSHER